MLSRFTSLTLFVLISSACSGIPLVGGGEQERDVRASAPTPSETRSEVQGPTGREAFALAPVPMIDVKPRAQAAYDQALAWVAGGDDVRAETFFKETLSIQKNLAGPWVNLGYIYERRGEAQAAKQAFEAALEANPENCDALNRLGIEARRAGAFAKAEEFYLKCLGANPGYASARLNLGILYELYLGRYGEALAAYQDYQLALVEPDPKVNGWLMDLERRVAALAQR